MFSIQFHNTGGSIGPFGNHGHANIRRKTGPLLCWTFTSAEDRVRALEGGADGYLTHPIDRMVLVATVRALLRLRVAEANAQRSAQQWEKTFNTLAEGLAILDADDRVLRWNGTFADLCGPLFTVTPRMEIRQHLVSLLGAGTLLLNAQNPRLSAQAEIGSRTVLLSLGLIDPYAAHSEKVLSLADITDRKLAECAIRTAERLAATGKFANTVAHEINNPLDLRKDREERHHLRRVLARAPVQVDFRAVERGVSLRNSARGSSPRQTLQCGK